MSVKLRKEGVHFFERESGPEVHIIGSECMKVSSFRSKQGEEGTPMVCVI